MENSYFPVVKNSSDFQIHLKEPDSRLRPAPKDAVNINDMKPERRSLRVEKYDILILR